MQEAIDYLKLKKETTHLEVVLWWFSRNTATILSQQEINFTQFFNIFGQTELFKILTTNELFEWSAERLKNIVDQKDIVWLYQYMENIYKDTNQKIINNNKLGKELNQLEDMLIDMYGIKIYSPQELKLLENVRTCAIHLKWRLLDLIWNTIKEETHKLLETKPEDIDLDKIFENSFCFGCLSKWTIPNLSNQIDLDCRVDKKILVQNAVWVMMSKYADGTNIDFLENLIYKYFLSLGKKIKIDFSNLTETE